MPEGDPVVAARLSHARLAIVVLLALAASIQIGRSALASNFVATNPEVAARAWPSHPRVLLANVMGEIGKSAAAGANASPASMDRAMVAARRGPLLTEPYLIAGAAALSRGEPEAAEGLFREARRRDPRSAAARYFLAQYYLASGRPVEGLAEASALTRLVAGSATALIPGLVQYAREPDAAPHLRKMFAANPTLGDSVLAELARDPANAALVVSLAGDDFGARTATVPSWQTQLLASLVQSGDYAEAHALWLRIGGLGTGTSGLFNPQFTRMKAPAPFNWTFGSGSFGVAEPAASGTLQVIYYGREDARFASQLLLLKPGAYELRMQVRRDGAAEEPSLLRWTLTCQAGTRQLSALPLTRAGAIGALAGRFTVPANCPAQLLVLEGKSGEFAKSEQVTISDLQLVGLR